MLFDFESWEKPLNVNSNYPSIMRKFEVCTYMYEIDFMGLVQLSL